MSAPGHPKTKELRLVLGCSLPQAIGHLELLWHFCAQHSPAGDIGKWSDPAIAEAAGWPETEPVAKFIEGLVSTGWLDRHSQHRLIIHDWRDHAPAWVSAKLHKLKIQWVISESAQRPLLEGGASPSTLLASPSLAKPSQDSKRGRATALPPDFTLTPQLLEFARAKGVTDVEAELEAFKAHHQAHGKVMKDWNAAWRTWCINAKKFGARNGTQATRNLSAVDRVRRATAEREAERQRRANTGDRRVVEKDVIDLRPPLDKPVR